MKTERIGRLIRSDSGAVAFEFIVTLPIYMLFLGIALLIFEMTMGKLHLQESNRNLAWLAGDRHFTDVSASNDMLLNKVTEYFTVRNKYESLIGAPSDYWGFGTNNTDFWAVSVIDKETGKGVFRPDTEWGLLAAGNMELRMNHFSALFLGMISVSSAFYPETDASGKKKVYETSFDLTRTKVPEDAMSVSGDDFRPESYLMRRRNRDTGRSENVLENVYSVISESWPAIDGDDSQTVQVPVNNSGGGMGGSSMYKRALSAWAH